MFTWRKPPFLIFFDLCKIVRVTAVKTCTHTLLRPNVLQFRTILVIQCKYFKTVQKVLVANASPQSKQTNKTLTSITCVQHLLFFKCNTTVLSQTIICRFIPVQCNVQNQLVYTVYLHAPTQYNPTSYLNVGCGKGIFVENHEAHTLHGTGIMQFVLYNVHFYLSRLFPCIH